MNARLVCKKCHVVFHMEPGGRPVLGEPQTGPSDDHRKHAKQGEHHSIFEVFHIPKLDDLTHLGDNLSDYSFPVKPVLGVLGVLIVGWMAFSIFSAPPESVADRAKTAVEALAHDDLDSLKTYATEKSRDDVIRWYDAAHARLEETRQSWPSKEATVQVVVVEEDVRTHKGEVEAIILPAQAASVIPTASSKPASKKPGASGPLAFHIHWVWSGSHWWLDGRQSLAVVGLP